MKGINVNIFDNAVDIEIGNVATIFIDGMGFCSYWRSGEGETGWGLIA